jgi:hypothetical protein
MNEVEARIDPRLNGRVAFFDWDACATCEHYPPERGGCDIHAPSDLLNFELSGDRLVCLKWEPKEVRGT